MKTWGDVFRACVRRGIDHGYAAWAADRYMKRKENKMSKKKKIVQCNDSDRCQKVMCDHFFKHVKSRHYDDRCPLMGDDDGKNGKCEPGM